MIVVDTNVIAYLLIRGNKTELAQATYRKDNSWLVPALWRHEFLNVVSTFVRHGGGTEADGRQIWQAGLSLLAQREESPDFQEALSLSIRHDISAYDAQFVSLASARQLQLVTEDRDLLQKFPDIARSMADFNDNRDRSSTSGRS
jgi:predicted nucleic acid-binding protein